MAKTELGEGSYGFSRKVKVMKPGVWWNGYMNSSISCGNIKRDHFPALLPYIVNAGSKVMTKVNFFLLLKQYFIAIIVKKKKLIVRLPDTVRKSFSFI